MDNRTTCAIFSTNSFRDNTGFMCKHCSGIQFNVDGNSYWKCNKYSIPLKENENKYLVRCLECIENGDD